MGRSFTFNGVTSDSKSLRCLTVSRSFLPTLAAKTIIVPNRPGAYYQRSDVGMRQITIGVSIVSNSLVNLDTLKQTIGAWLYPDNQIRTLVLPDEPDKTYYAVLDGDTQLALLFAAGSGTLIFVCADPMAYGTETSLAFANGTASPNVSGTYKTFPRIEVTFTSAVTNFKLTNTDTGDFAMVDHVFAAGDTLTIDCSKSLIEINGVAAMADLDLTSNFFSLQPGNNALSVDSGASATCTVYWTPRWL